MDKNHTEIQKGYSLLSKTISDNDTYYRDSLGRIEKSITNINNRISSPTTLSKDTIDEKWTTTEYCMAGAGVAALGGAIYFMTR